MSGRSAVYGRLLAGTHKCPGHQHRTYFCQSCRRTAFDRPVREGCREALRMGTPDGGLTSERRGRGRAAAVSMFKVSRDQRLEQEVVTV